VFVGLKPEGVDSVEDKIGHADVDEELIKDGEQ
jgi:hypothetical protein